MSLNFRSLSSRTLFAAGIFCLLSSSARAQFFTSATGLANPAQTITFGEHTFGLLTPITNQFADLGVTFSPNMYYVLAGGSASGISGDYLSNFHDGQVQIVPMSILFSSNRTAFAIAVGTNTTTTLFEALLNGSVVGSQSTATSLGSPTPYSGFTNLLFNEIRITPGGDHAMLIDNLQLGAAVSTVPEPGTFALLAAFLIPGAAILRRRNR